MIEPDDIKLDWHINGAAPGDSPDARQRFSGYEFGDFFHDQAEWTRQSYDTPEEVFAAASGAYKGPDSDGTGVAVKVWDGTEHHTCYLFPDIAW
jgi:hypothetical protein